MKTGTKKTPLPLLPRNGVAADDGRGRRPAKTLEYTYLPGFPYPVPLLYEDEGKVDMGEAEVHTLTTAILFYGMKFHLAKRSGHTAFANLNLYYAPAKRKAYVSPDVMIVPGSESAFGKLTSYRIGKHGPAPTVVFEVLSQWTYEDGDLTEKPTIYAGIGVQEYILVDVTGEFLARRLLLKRRQPDGTWADEQDPDGGVTSQLGFRVAIDADGQVRVLDAETGTPYARPDDAQAEADARGRAEQKVRELEAELERLRPETPSRKRGRRKT